MVARLTLERDRANEDFSIDTVSVPQEEVLNSSGDSPEENSDP